MSHAVEFIETPIFTKQIAELATDEELGTLQVELIANPLRGDLIQGTGGLRKIRLATGNQGKSRSARVIYFLATEDIIFFVLAYAKNAKSSLTDKEKKILKNLTDQLRSEV